MTCLTLWWRNSKMLTAVTAVALTFVLAACSDSNNDNNQIGETLKPQPANPLVEEVTVIGGGDTCCTIVGGAIDLRDQNYTPGTAFYSGLAFDAAEVRYKETEYFISGTAVSYVATEELGPDGVWSLQEADAAEYKTRIVVRRPIDDANFNGTVMVEWFNVSGGLDASPSFLATHTEMEREGYAWVGVSAQSVGVEGGGGAFDISLKVVDSVRYGILNHPGDSYSYDIFSQAAQAVMRPQGLDPLEGLVPERMIAVGQSQSAFRLVSYVNGVSPLIDLFDAFLLMARGGGSASISQPPLADVPTPEAVFIRTDQAIPVITLQSETDIFVLNSVTSRQEDSVHFRLWEVPGTAHSDIYTTLKSPNDKGDDPGIAAVIAESEVRPPFIRCSFPANDGGMHFSANAAVAALDTWMRTGNPAPSANFLDTVDIERSFMYDNVGNVTGGLRNHYVDVPVAMLSGEGQPRTDNFCNLFGITELFDEARLAELYPDKQSYTDAIDRSVDESVDQRFLRPKDADLIKAQARLSGIGGDN
jgi:hypothetical protein